MNHKFNISTAFIITSGSVFILGTYLLTTKTSLHPQFIITACGEIVRNIKGHIHFNPDGIVTSLIISVAAVGLGLSLTRLVRFITSHHKLVSLQTIKVLPDNLEWVMKRHQMPRNSIIVVTSHLLTAYTIGIFKPRVVISISLINITTRKQLEAVILHELYHIYSRHTLWLLLSRIISSLFFFVPLIEHLAQEIKIEFELAADAFVVKKQHTRDHVCSALALNLQYVDDTTPHFAASPIETRVESLIHKKVVLGKISLRPLSMSLISVSLMAGIAVTKPNQAVSGFTPVPDAFCQVGEVCQTTDCDNHQSNKVPNHTPLVPASYSLSSSH
jgi:beta-lactamase regulating signal transducer with metallopeptidase domain